MIDIEMIGACVRSQFCWDLKSANRWYLRSLDRDDFFCKDMGIMVLMNVAQLYKVEPVKISKYLVIPNDKERFLNEWMAKILVFQPESDYEKWLRQTLIVKSGLTKNLVFYKYGVKPLD